MTIGQRIAELRKRAGLSQEALGEKLGVSRQAISKWESDAALPDIDKLVGLARVFEVTVGWLLGVEELPAPAQPQENDGAQTNEALEQYLEKLSQHQKLSPKLKKRLIAAGVVATACLVFLTVRVVSLQGELSGVRSTVNGLSNQIGYVQNSINNIDANINAQVQEALNEEYGLLTDYSLKLDKVDYAANTAELTLTAVVRETPPDPEMLSFYAVRADGTTIYAQRQNWDAASGSYTGTLTLPLEDGLNYYFSTGDKRTGIVDYSFSDLKSATSIALNVDLYGGFTVGKDASRLDGGVDVQTYSDQLSSVAASMDEQWVSWLPHDVTEQKAWIVVSAPDGTELSRQELEMKRANDTESITTEGLSCYEYTWETTDVTVNIDQPEKGTLIWAEAEMTFDNGQSARSQSSTGFRWSGSNWEDVTYIYETQQYQ